MPLASGDGEPAGTDRDEKRPGAFRTITEVARELAVEPHVLRFWESRFAQIRPIKRAGGRRYYRPDDVDLLRGVRQLLHGQGYTIRGAQRILKGQGVRFVQAVGRGEARAGAPPPQERDMREMRDEQGNGPEDRAEPPAPAGRAALEAVLRELRACRDILAEIGSDEPVDPV